MIDLKIIQQEPDAVEAALKKRNPSLSLSEVCAIDAERKRTIVEHDELRHKQRELSEVFRSKAPAEEKAAARETLKDVSSKVKGLHDRVGELESDLKTAILQLPNPPSDETPVGKDEEDNTVFRKAPPLKEFGFEPRDHHELGTNLGIFNFEQGATVSGSRFVMYRGYGARLERALASFMLDMHVDRGYTEILPPFLVNRDSMTGTGQLPKFEEDAFSSTDDLFLIPTAEVPVTNMHRDAILSPEELPIKYCAYSACFRREAGSYGQVTRGLIRLHQFQKVELVHFCLPEESAETHLRLLDNAEEVLRRLELPYRVVELCSGDLGFSAKRCFDIEVWCPGQDRFLEISSCSNFGDFQARRINIRYRPEAGSKPRFVHTLNGSGLAIGRTIVAILENGQQEDGSVILPKALVPYMGGVDRLTPPQS